MPKTNPPELQIIREKLIGALAETVSEPYRSGEWRWSMPWTSARGASAKAMTTRKKAG